MEQQSSEYIILSFSLYLLTKYLSYLFILYYNDFLIYYEYASFKEKNLEKVKCQAVDLQTNSLEIKIDYLKIS